MKYRVKLWGVFIWLLLMTGGCREKYVSGVIVPSSGYLVVEGFINTGGPTDISLSRTTSLDSSFILPETGASVEVLDAQGNHFSLYENGAGSYSVPQFDIDFTTRYRLHIRTADGKDYLSDSLTARISPPIDSVNWKQTSDGVNIYVSTHDNLKNASYYDWFYEETWQYYAVAKSNYIFQDSQVIPRPAIYDTIPPFCWISDTAKTILLSSTANLSADVISEFPITSVGYISSNKLIQRYSILVKQRSLTKDWYNWEQRIKKNTEQLGTIFDAQPSETGGNLHCTSDPLQPVIGFVGCTSRSEFRLFIDRSQLPPIERITTGYESCMEVKKGNAYDSLYGVTPPQFITNVDRTPMGVITAVYVSPGSCVDCRLLGGTKNKPAFW